MVNKWKILRQSIALHCRCLTCGSMQASSIALCHSCLSRLERVEMPCIQCGEPLPLEAVGKHQCGHCLSNPPAFDACIAPMSYASSIRELHQAFKFQQNLAAGKVLTSLLSEALRKRHGPFPELLIPVPLHASRMRQRGFDQALEITKGISHALSIAYDDTLLARQRQTAPQSGLNSKQRHKNLARAFIVNTVPEKKHIALIDDIMTTGSTFNAAALALKQAGVKSVEVWAVSRTLSPR